MITDEEIEEAMQRAETRRKANAELRQRLADVKAALGTRAAVGVAQKVQRELRMTNWQMVELLQGILF
jgi:hypothetical protein